MAGTSTVETSPAVSGIPIQQSAYGVPIALVYGRNRLAVNLLDYFNFVVHENRQSQGSSGKGGGVDTVSYTYTASLICAIGEGPLTALRVWRGQQVYSAADATSQLGLAFMPGTAGQATWSQLPSDHLLGYSESALMYAANYPLDNNAAIPNHTVEVQSSHGSDPSPLVPILDLMARVGVPSSRIGSTDVAATYIAAMSLSACPVYSSSTAAADLIDELCTVANLGIVLIDGVLQFIPFSTQAAGGYVPNTTPVYDLVDDHFQPTNDATSPPITCVRKGEADTWNHIRVQFNNVDRDYNIDTREAKDDESIARSGLRSKEQQTFDSITRAAVAQQVAQQILQREVAIRNTYTFRLGAQFALLAPMDLVSITDTVMGLSRQVVRITSLTERDDDTFDVEAEDAPMAAYAPALYQFENAVGLQPNFNITPDGTAAPVIYELPVATVGGTGLGLVFGLTGLGANWGGCSIWMSLDGSSYSKIGITTVPDRIGTTTTALSDSATSFGISLSGIGGQLLSGTANDAASDATLCWIGHAGTGEYVSYQTATLLAANSYNLAGVLRDRQGTLPAAWPVGSQFARVRADGPQTSALPISLIGATVYFKFTARNAFGAREQSLADVTAVPYTVTGQMVLLQPPAPTGLLLTIENNGIRITWDKPQTPNYAATIIRVGGSSWETATEVLRKNATTHLLSWQQAGTLTVWAKHLNTLGVESANATQVILVVRAPLAVTITRHDAQVNSVAIGWTDAKSDQPIKSYAMYTADAGVDFSGATLFGKAGADSRSDIVVFRSAGNKRIFVIAEDIAGNVGSPAYIDIAVTLPNNYTLAADVAADWSGSMTNAYYDSTLGGVVMGMRPETWAQHFSRQGVSTIGDQIAAGYPQYFEPSETTASYTQVWDLGKAYPSIRCTAVQQFIQLAGQYTPQIQIDSSLDNVNWVLGAMGQADVQLGNVRYVRITLQQLGAGGDDLVCVQQLKATIGVEDRTEVAFLTLNASDASGTVYVTNRGFYDIVSATFTPSPSTLGGSSPIAKWNVYISDSDAPTTPARVYVQAWDSSNNRVSGQGSLQIAGF